MDQLKECEMARNFIKSRQQVANRGIPPKAFLNELVDWCLSAPDEIFVRNERSDVYSSVVNQLGPFTSLVHRKAVMLEVLRVLGGFESSWKWNEGVDTTNPDSNTPCSEEAGIFQCSGDSMDIDSSLKALMLTTTGETDCEKFKTETKSNHPFAIEYCARLLRFTTSHHGPIKHHKIHEWLRREAVAEFEAFLTE
jgi:hypothetical protein